MLANDDWKYDIIPEIIEGKNIADFVDPDILEKLEALEAEEEKLEAEGFYDESDEDIEDEEDIAVREAAEAIRKRQAMAKQLAQEKKGSKNKNILPRKDQQRTLSQMAEKMKSIGIDPSSVTARAQLLAKAKGIKMTGDGKRKRSGDDDEEMEVDDDWEDSEDFAAGDDSMEVDGDLSTSSRKKSKTNSGKATSSVRLRDQAAGIGKTTKSGGRPSARAGPVRRAGKDRQQDGLPNKETRVKAAQLGHLGVRERNREAKAGESDRAIKVAMPKWLYAGKRGKGTSRSR